MNALVIENAPITYELVSLLCRTLKVRTSRVSTSEDARAALRAGGHDLVVIEPLVDPGGMDLLAEIRTDTSLSRIPVLVLTGTTCKQDVLRIVELGVSHCVLKQTFTISSFLKRLRAAVTQRPAPSSPEKAPAPPAATAQTAAAPHDPARAPSLAAAGSELRDLKPLICRSHLSERIQEVSELRALSPTVANVIRLASSAETSIDALVKAVRVDHAIALKIIKLANSSAFTRGDPVSSVRDAVLRIGTQSLRQAVANIGVIDQFGDTGALPGLTPEGFWAHSLGVATCAAELARETRAMPPDEAFTTGLLHDVGRLLLAEAIPEEYAQVFAKAEALSLPLEQVEKRMLLMSHADLMQDVLRIWGMPRDLADPIAGHHLSMSNIRAMSPKHVTPTAILALSNRTVHALRIGASGNPSLYPTETFLEALSVSRTQYDGVCERVPEMTEDLQMGMLHAPPAPAGNTGAPHGVLYVTADPDRDAVGRFFGLGADLEETPTVAVVRLRNARECVAITRKLLEREKGAGCGPLPVLALSENGKLAPQENVMQGRAGVLLPLPTTRHRVAEALGELAQTATGAGGEPARATAA